MKILKIADAFVNLDNAVAIDTTTWNHATGVSIKVITHTDSWSTTISNISLEEVQRALAYVFRERYNATYTDLFEVMARLRRSITG